MKKTNLMFTLLAATMLIASCGKSSQAAPSSSSSDSAPDVVYPSWKDEEVANFVETFGEAIPCPRGISESYTFELGAYEDGTPVIYVNDKVCGDIVADYRNELAAAGWAEDVDRRDVGANYTTYFYVKDFAESRGDRHVYNCQVDFSSDGFEITCDEYIYPLTYSGSTWNGDLVNSAFDGFDDYQDLLPAYAAGEGNTLTIQEADYHEYLGYPYFCAKISNTNLNEVSAWFDAIAEAGKMYSYVESMGDDFDTGETACDNGNACETAIEGFQHHTYEMFFDEDFAVFMTVDNYLDVITEAPFIYIEVMYWA